MVDRNSNLVRLSNGLDPDHNGSGHRQNLLQHHNHHSSISFSGHQQTTRHFNNHECESASGHTSIPMPTRSRFRITDILAGASSPITFHGSSQRLPSSPPSVARDLSVRQQSKSSFHNSIVDEDSDGSHHDAVSESSIGK